MTENEKLRLLLAEARDGYVRHNLDCADVVCDACSFAGEIDAALAEPMEACARCEETEHDKAVAAAWWARCDEVERERDEARAEVARLRWGNEMACENTPTKGCECSGCGLARERAERGEVGP